MVHFLVVVAVQADEDGPMRLLESFSRAAQITQDAQESEQAFDPAKWRGSQLYIIHWLLGFVWWWAGAASSLLSFSFPSLAILSCWKPPCASAWHLM